MKGAMEVLKNRKEKLNKITSFLEMPEEIMTDKPRMTILGFDKNMLKSSVKNCKKKMMIF